MVLLEIAEVKIVSLHDRLNGVVSSWGRLDVECSNQVGRLYLKSTTQITRYFK